MPKLKSPVEILKLLNRSNCRECNEPTCMAFAAKVFTGQRSIEECPHIEGDAHSQFSDAHPAPNPADEVQESVIGRLKDQLRHFDLAAASKRLDARFKGGRLILKVCGKDFSVDSKGNFSSDIHAHPWLALPLLNYVLEGKGLDPTGQWLPFRELKGGKDWARFFEHRCEKTMKKVADTYPDFFADMLDLFAGKQVERHYDSDISLVLHPLPKVPILICYWQPEDGLGSDFHLFFDSTAEKNLRIDSIYTLTTGLAVMFEKIAMRHN